MPHYNEYVLGATVTVSAEFKNGAGEYVDPTKVIFKYRTPPGVTASSVYPDAALITRVATGQYYYQLDIPTASAGASGTWFYGWYGTTALKAASEFGFKVKNSPF